MVEVPDSRLVVEVEDSKVVVEVGDSMLLDHVVEAGRDVVENLDHDHDHDFDLLMLNLIGIYLDPWSWFLKWIGDCEYVIWRKDGKMWLWISELWFLKGDNFFFLKMWLKSNGNSNGTKN